MKNIIRILLLMLAVLTVYGCQNGSTGGAGDVSNGILPPIDGGDNGGDGGDNGTEEPEYPDIDNPENPDNETLPVLEDEIESPEIIDAENGKDKFSGNGSYSSTSKVGFYDKINGVDREVYTNIEGEIAGNVQFMQTHNVLPSGNKLNSKPSLTAYKPALLILTTNVFYKSISLNVKTGNKEYRVSMDPPAVLPESDSTRADKKEVAFSNKAWSAFIPEKYIRGGLEITFTAIDNSGNSYTGILNKDAVDVESPVEATYFLLRLGVLENVPEYTSTDNYLINNTAKALQEYYQTVPFGKITFAQYNKLKLDKVMASDGSVKTSGLNNDLHKYVTEKHIGQGISLANKGIAYSYEGDDYQTGKDSLYVVLNQIATSRTPSTDNKGVISISNTRDNEFSRFSGYVFGLEDNYSIDKNYFGSVHNYNTGWGYDSYKDRTRGNLSWNDNGSAIEFNGYTIAGYNNMYGWKKDPMSRGEADSTISNYPYHTALTAKKIQDDAGLRYMVSDKKYKGHYPYIYWNKKDNKYKYVTDEAFLSTRLAPTEYGVPVYTVIGGYVANNSSKVLIYPALEGNYGHVFGDLFVAEKPAGNYLKITYADGSVKYVKLGNKADGLERFHVNIAQSSKPVKVVLMINGLTGTEINIASSGVEQKEVVVVGKGAGYSMAIKSDISELNTNLSNYDVNSYVLNDRAMEIINTLKFNNAVDNITSVNTKDIVMDYMTKKEDVAKITSYLRNNKSEIENANLTKLDELKELLSPYDAKPVDYIGQQLKSLSGQCFEIQNQNGKMHAMRVNCVADRKEQLWFMDRYSRIRPVSHPHLCMNNTMENGLTACNFYNDRKWRKHADYPNKNVIQNVGGYFNCLDHGAGFLKQYQCFGSPNQSFEAMLNQKENQRYNVGLAKINNRCISVADNKTVNTSSCPDTVSDNDSYKWFIDVNGRIHSAKFPTYCMEPGTDNKINVIQCSDKAGQKWVKKQNNTYENVGSAGKCLDDYSSEGRLGVWNCKADSSSNQVFTTIINVESNKAVSIFDGELLEELDRVLLY